MKYLRKYSDYNDYLVFKQSNNFIKPSMSYCFNASGIKYNPVTYFYIRSNLKKSDTTLKIRYQNNMTINIMDYLYSTTQYIPPYCGTALIENTNITDAVVNNPVVTQMINNNPYSFVPEEGKTYCIIQQLVANLQILYPAVQYTYNKNTNVINNFFLYFYVPNMVNDAGMIINGVEYKNSSQDSTKKVNITSKLTIGSTVFTRANSVTVYLDILSLLKQGNTLNITPFIVNIDGTRVDSRIIGQLTISSEADLTALKTSDVNMSRPTNQSYPNFLTPET